MRQRILGRILVRGRHLVRLIKDVTSGLIPVRDGRMLRVVDSHVRAFCKESFPKLCEYFLFHKKPFCSVRPFPPIVEFFGRLPL